MVRAGRTPRAARDMGAESYTYIGHDELVAMQVMENYNRNIVAILKRYLEDSEKVVDFGAGVGTLAEMMRDAADIHCVEPDDRQRSVIAQKGFKTFTDIREIDEKSITFLYSSNVLEHIEDDFGIVAEIHRKMKDRGRVVFYVPAFQSLYTSNDARVGHFRRYDRKRLHDVFGKAGFQIEKVFFADVLGILAVFLYKAVGSEEGRLDLGQLKVYDRLIFPVSKTLDLFFGRLVGKNLVLVARK